MTLPIAEEVALREAQAATAIALPNGGALFRFVARYRTKAASRLDGAQLPALQVQLTTDWTVACPVATRL